eukprot:CAMPEP_0172155238 /NCGR_PEP_ID=MMETSP1050-20130122/2512_1 /TAXON_ID=233186 /ORGANISM="Cryptomonas curvata, Strain CCAP979/52" /LENGTH=131 /DNA_ID=CAMNT_0012824109 /DNA_START=1160 /DNA_END=1555 /DNA_ORIENTATION=+
MSSPLQVGGQPMKRTKRPSAVKACIRLLPQSATNISPLLISVDEDEEGGVQAASTAMPRGSLNCPSPQPGVPKLERKIPSGENTCTRRFPPSTTSSLPALSNATPHGPRNCPGPDPSEPKLPAAKPSALKT